MFGIFFKDKGTSKNQNCILGKQRNSKRCTITNTYEYDPSPVKLALLEKGMDIDVKKPKTAKLDDDLYRLMEMQYA